MNTTMTTMSNMITIPTISNDIIINNISPTISNTNATNISSINDDDTCFNIFNILAITGYAERISITSDTKYYDIINDISKIKFIIKNFNRICDIRLNKPINLYDIETPISKNNFVIYCKLRYNTSEEYLLESLIHLKMYIEHLKYIIVEWDEFNKNKMYNDDIYLKLCNYCKEIHNLIENGYYYNYMDCIISCIYLKYDGEFSETIYKKSQKNVKEQECFDKKTKNDDIINEIKIKIYEYHYRIVKQKWKELC